MMLPPGRLRLVTRPRITGSLPVMNKTGMDSCALACKGRRRAAGSHEDGHPVANEISRQCRQAVVMAKRPAVFDRKILALAMTGFPQA